MDNKDNKRGFSGLSDLASDIDTLPDSQSNQTRSQPAESQKTVFPLIAPTKWPTLPAPWSSVDNGETWVWEDFFLTFQKKPKSIYNLTTEMQGEKAEYRGMTYHYAMSVFYRLDKNPHGPSRLPIMTIALEQADMGILAQMLGNETEDLNQVESGSKMGPLMIGLFTSETHLNFGEFEEETSPQSVKRRFFEILGHQLGISGQPKMIGDLNQAYGHPETGLPAQEKNTEFASDISNIEESLGSETEAKPSTPKQSHQPQRKSIPTKPEQQTRSSQPLIETVSSGQSGGGSGGKWILGIISAVFLIWLFNNEGQSNKNPSYNSSSSSQSYSYPQSSPQPLVRSSSTSQSSGLHYNTKPSIGTNNVLSVPEIRWCVSEGIRIEAMRNIIDTNAAIDRFNLIVNDYNSRCGSYQYRQESQQRAERDVEAYRDQIIAEAIRDARQLGHSYQPSSSSVSSSSSLNSSPKRLSTQYIKETQQLLANLGYNPGPVDGIYGRKTKNAIIAFENDYGLPSKGEVTTFLLNKLRTAAFRSQKSGSEGAVVQQGSVVGPHKAKAAWDTAERLRKIR